MWEKFKEAAFGLAYPFKRKKVDLTSAVLGWRASSFSLLPQSKPAKDSGVMMTTLW